MKTETDSKTSLEFKKGGISINIRPTIKDGTEYFVLDYRVKGQRKLVWRSTLVKARKAAGEAVDKILDGEAEVLELTSADKHIYLRAIESLAGMDVELDHVARDHADCLKLLAGRASVVEVCRDWVKRNDKTLVKITVTDAVEKLKVAARADKKSPHRLKQFSNVLDRFVEAMNCEVHTLTPDLVSQYLTALPLGERSKRNHRDVLGHFFRWLALRGYLPKGTDLLEGVQNYSARKIGEIEIYSPDELSKLLEHANGMTAFIAIQAFSGLRHAEVARLEYSQIDLDDGFIEVKAINSKTGERRLVPIPDNLKQWLLLHRQPRGKICSSKNATKQLNTTKQLLKIAAAAGVPWKHNGLRHSAISYRIAQCADVPRVADECGNSVAVIRGHYLRRVKPAEATRWFSIVPAVAEGKVIQMADAR